MVVLNGTNLHVEEISPVGVTEPAGPAAVLIHGIAPDNLASWYLTLAYPLAKAGMRVLLYDLRGHGRSARPVTGYQLDDFLDDLDELLAHWQVAAPVYLLGNSLGGAVAFGYAARRSQAVAGIVTIESATPSTAWFSGMAEFVTRVRATPADESVTPPGRDGTPLSDAQTREVRTLLATTRIGEELPASQAPDPHRLASIDCPVLCLYGQNSTLRRTASATRRLLPQVRTVVIPGQEHTLLIDDPRQVGAHVLPWLAARRPTIAKNV